MTEAAARAAGVKVGVAGPNQIEYRIKVFGRVLLDAAATVTVAVPHAGSVDHVAVVVGDRVEPGDLLGRLRSRTTLASYALRATTAGTVTHANIATGDTVAADQKAFVVADISQVWVDLDVHAHDLGHVAAGQRADIQAGPARAVGEISYVSPLANPESQTVAARVVVDNPSGLWRPGLYATGWIVLEERRVPVAINFAAVHTMEDGNVIFVREGDEFRARVVELGRRDGKRVEVRSGLKAGERYAASGAFVVAAEIGKAGAVHAH